jgi:hypothetical protein
MADLPFPAGSDVLEELVGRCRFNPMFRKRLEHGGQGESLVPPY